MRLGKAVPMKARRPRGPRTYRALRVADSLDEAQALLSRKLEEARVIIRELEKRTGLRLTLSRNFQIAIDLRRR